MCIRDSILNIIIGEKQIEEKKKTEILKAYKRGIDQQYFNANLPFFNDTATTEIYTRKIVGSVRCV